MFDNTPAAKEGTLQSGDELVAINGTTVKGRTKVEVAKMIQGTQVHIYFLNIAEVSMHSCCYIINHSVSGYRQK